MLTDDPKRFEIHLSQMKRFAALSTILVASSCFAQTARDYYNEIYAAGGLDRMADRYVCFNEDLNHRSTRFALSLSSRTASRDMISAQG